jgi:hypothetical protein
MSHVSAGAVMTLVVPLALLVVVLALWFLDPRSGFTRRRVQRPARVSDRDEAPEA